MEFENIWCGLFNCWCEDVEEIIGNEYIEVSDECAMDCESCLFAEEGI